MQYSYDERTPPFGSVADGAGALMDLSTLPDMAADMAEIRRRVLGRAPSAPATEAEERQIYNTLRGNHQVDLDKEENLANLEDAARERLCQSAKAMLRLPLREDLRSQHAAAVREVSDLVRRLDDSTVAHHERAEQAGRQGRVLAMLAAGHVPYGFTQAVGRATVADPAFQQAMALAATLADATAANYDGLLKETNETREALFRLRREVEQVGDGLLSLIEASENDRRTQREYLQLGARAGRAVEPLEPPESYGEQLMAAAALPEEASVFREGPR